MQILLLKDLYLIQLYNIYYKNYNNLLPAYFQRFTPNYNDDTDYNHDLRYNVLRLPMTRKEYYVQCTTYQFLKLIRETSQMDLDRCLTSSITQKCLLSSASGSLFESISWQQNPPSPPPPPPVIRNYKRFLSYHIL